MYLRPIRIQLCDLSSTPLGVGLPEVWGYKHKVTYKDVLLYQHVLLQPDYLKLQLSYNGHCQYW